MSDSEKEYSAQESKKGLGFSKVLQKISAYCAYQERCLFEVRNKLGDYGLNSEEEEKIINKLVEQDFINEKRFAETFVRGRFTLKKWGKVRIRQELKMRSLPNNLISTALGQIDDEAYAATLIQLAQRKWVLTKENDPNKKKAKVHRFLMFRGFEPDLIKESLDTIQSDTSE